jgi:hypothetical protein
MIVFNNKKMEVQFKLRINVVSDKNVFKDIYHCLNRDLVLDHVTKNDGIMERIKDIAFESKNVNVTFADVKENGEKIRHIIVATVTFETTDYYHQDVLKNILEKYALHYRNNPCSIGFASCNFNVIEVTILKHPDNVEWLMHEKIDIPDKGKGWYLGVILDEENVIIHHETFMMDPFSISDEQFKRAIDAFTYYFNNYNWCKRFMAYDCITKEKIYECPDVIKKYGPTVLRAQYLFDIIINNIETGDKNIYHSSNRQEIFEKLSKNEDIRKGIIELIPGAKNFDIVMFSMFDVGSFAFTISIECDIGDEYYSEKSLQKLSPTFKPVIIDNFECSFKFMGNRFLKWPDDKDIKINEHLVIEKHDENLYCVIYRYYQTVGFIHYKEYIETKSLDECKSIIENNEKFKDKKIEIYHCSTRKLVYST